MTDKYILKNGEILDTSTNITFTDFVDVLILINGQSRRISELKQAYSTLNHRHSLLHDELIDIECKIDGLKKDTCSLEKENGQLKSSINELCTEIKEKNMTTTEILVKLINILDKVD